MNLKRRKAMLRISPKQKKAQAKYYAEKYKYMEAHPFCEMHLLNGFQIYATDLHHKRGRGKYIADPRYFASLCSECHQYIHEHSNWARENGWLIR